MRHDPPPQDGVTAYAPESLVAREPAAGASSGAVEYADPLNWYALYTKSRHERAVDKRLRARGFETFLPITEKLRRWSDRKRLVAVPLFPGYVFVHCTDALRARAWGVPGVVRYLGQAGRAAVIPDEEIDAVRDVLSRQVPCDAHRDLCVGQRVTVVSGPLEGLRGTLVSKGRKHRLVLWIQVMGMGVAADVDATDVEAG